MRAFVVVSLILSLIACAFAGTTEEGLKWLAENKEKEVGVVSRDGVISRDGVH